MDTWTDNLLHFYSNLNPLEGLPNNIIWLHPQKQEAVQKILKLFFQKYYSDNNERTLLLGIIPEDMVQELPV